ncbi:MAG: ATP-binding cassette domain-containing protein [Pseudomonadota bacterium]
MLELLKIEGLSVNLDGKDILENINFVVPEGKIITIVGPNGSGKTTLARCLLKLIEPTKGRVTYSPNLKIGYLPQKITLNPHLPITVRDFLETNRDIKLSFSNIVEEVNIKHILSYPLQRISGGEMQRVLLARALLNKPKLLILDEPVQGVDVNGQVEFYQLIEKLRAEKNITVLMISHDLHMVMKNTDYVICLNHHICCEGEASFINQHKDFRELFNSDELMNFSVYTHRHNHSHE